MSQQIFEEQIGGPLKNNDTGKGRALPVVVALPGKRKTTDAGRINAIINSATAAVHGRHHYASSWSNTGTNISYEGATAPGAGGSAGTGQASGQSATGCRITSTDPGVAAAAGFNHHKKGIQVGTDPGKTGQDPLYKDHDDGHETMGNP